VIYADVFYTRPRAEEGRRAANDRLRIKIGGVSIGTRRWAELVTLPTDAR
jgi:hypothetical protein